MKRRKKMNYCCLSQNYIQIFMKHSKTQRCIENPIKVNESSYKQCRVIPHFSTGQNLLKKILRKDKYWQKVSTEKSKYWHNQLRSGKVKDELRVPIYELRVQICELRVQIHELRVQIRELWVQIHKLEE